MEPLRLLLPAGLGMGRHPRASGPRGRVGALPLGGLLLLGGLLAAAPAAAQPVGDSPAADRAIDRAVAETLTEARSRLAPAEVARLARAISFAREAHRGQVRSGGDPYLLHPLRVTRGVLGAGANVEVAKAAVLHDVVEDTRFRLQDIRARFGPRVATYVHAVTHEPVERFGGDKEARNRVYYERLSRAPTGAHLIKYVDRMDNIRDMRGWPIEGKLGYLASTRVTVIPAIEGRSPELARRLAAEVEVLQRRYETELRVAGERLGAYRRADGTLRWRALVADRARTEGAGLLHFTLALFLKELAVVVRTGDRDRMDEFFDGLTSTDFFVHYGTFALGARAGEVAYVRYLSRYVRPGFVNGLVRSNVALAAGLALPQLVRGEFEGRSFAISLASLGLSVTAVRSGLAALEAAGGAGRCSAPARAAAVAGAGTASGRSLAGLGLKVKRLAGAGAWFYTVAETAVVLYLADGIESRVRGHLDAKAAREAVAEAGRRLFAALARPDLGPDALAAALSAYRDAWTDYRDYLYTPVLLEEARLDARLEELAREAKLAADERDALLARLDVAPALRARLEATHGSLGAYADGRELALDARLADGVAEAVGRYERAVDSGLAAVYAAPRREGDYLAGLRASDRAWLQAGLVARGAGDPEGARSDPLAAIGRRLALRRVNAALADASPNRLQTYEDERAALALVARALGSRPAASRPELRAVLAASLDELERIHAFDRRLAGGEAVGGGSAGLVGTLSGEAERD